MSSNQPNSVSSESEKLNSVGFSTHERSAVVLTPIEAAFLLVGCSRPNGEAGATNSDHPSSQNDWDAYKSAHVSGGRVPDGLSGNVSHSEGQGTDSLLAVADSIFTTGMPTVPRSVDC